MSLVVLTIIMAFGVVLTLGYAAINYFTVKRLDEGNERMRQIAAAIRLGASTFINYEYRVVAAISAVIAVILGVLISWQMAVAFVIGAIMSGTAGFVGMKIATYSNVRVTNMAEKTRNLGETLKVAYRGGTVMGLSVGGFAMLGIIIVYLVFGQAMGQLDALIAGNVPENWWGLPVTFTVTLSGYALGCSIIAMFNRVGGGIYTKAADMGADLVGKTEYHIPEDDPRNPATIADNVGDNVGDVAGLGSDLLESYVGAILSAVILALEVFRDVHVIVSENLVRAMIHFPLIFAAGGLVACVLGIASLFVKRKLSDNPHRELNLSTWISATLTIVFGVLMAWLLFSKVDVIDMKKAGFAAGWISPLLASAMGVLSGIVVGVFAEYYTSYSFKPTKTIAEATREGVGLTITEGMSVGMRSTMYPSITLGVAILGAYLLAGMYGVAMAATGMLSFVVTTVSVDTYGPIADNAGGIAEMSFLDDEVRQITDTLDAVGNTTAAIGKGFAIGSAALAALSMMTSYLYSFTPAEAELFLNAIHPLTLVGMIVGAAFPWMFSGMLIDSVTKTARVMVVEVRRQFREIKGLIEGEVLPDYESCISIASRGALREMRAPALLAVVVPVISGLIFGPIFVAGLLLGSTLSAVMLALFTGNIGGAWDNAKKYIEVGGVKGVDRDSPEHDAAIVGDTVGDPLKDTVGPSLDILIKIMSVVSLVMGSVFARFNLLDWIRSLFG
ncbi:MAG: sodium-translocating pyrophosphatase [Clostridiaceae bacterium]|jgi:K(+)-stimulated pyrophosphate-energized sodium pump|nr:sodium-translocating pyrophosphatase [Clostridia bacterium]MBP6161513.1 sodium-translocating pyrophosphatase [Clostridia bacterium]MBP6949713.1 sodium-translocating pyrophosphatase [Clostridia bacterium]NMA35709.1 sodium-translocating pyrophosphatase [Clostridiaceae bacterium]